jgi:small-conductance mechanosensitive channel
LLASALIGGKFSQPVDTIGDWLRDGLLPATVLVLGSTLVVRLAKSAMGAYRLRVNEQIARSVDEEDVASEALKRRLAVAQAVEWAFSAVVYLVAGGLAFRALGLPLATLVAPATVVGVGLGFGAQQVVGDLLTGFFLLAEHQFGFGDVIRFSQPGRTDGVLGTVQELTLRVTKLRTPGGELVIIPNGSLRQVTNLSKEWSRALVHVPVAVDEDLERATAVLLKAAQTLAAEEAWNSLLFGEPVVTGVEAVEVGFVRLRLVVRTLPGKQFDVARELRLRCAVAFTEAGIASPSVELPEAIGR